MRLPLFCGLGGKKLWTSEGAVGMDLISNIWKHPQTSVAGLLIGVVTIAGVLSQQGVTLGNAGSGSVIALISGIAAALLGLLARDPQSGASEVGGSAKLGAWALISVLLMGTMMTGCSGVTVAQDIVNWTPTLQSAVAAVDSTGAVLDPAAAPIFITATVGFDAASNLLVAQAKAYLANPSASLLTQLQAQVVAFQQQVNASLLAAARIVNPSSQQHALSVIQMVGTAVNAIFALIEQVSGKVALAGLTTSGTIKLAMVEPYRNRQLEAEMVAKHYDEPVVMARVQIANAERAEVQAGF
jgi:CheY-like chemotaxis protein